MAIVTESYFYPVAAQLGAFTRFSKQVLLFGFLVLRIAKLSPKLSTYRWDELFDKFFDEFL